MVECCEGVKTAAGCTRGRVLRELVRRGRCMWSSLSSSSECLGLGVSEGQGTGVGVVMKGRAERVELARCDVGREWGAGVATGGRSSSSCVAVWISPWS